jgi:hypothetical protein
MHSTCKLINKGFFFLKKKKKEREREREKKKKRACSKRIVIMINLKNWKEKQ